MGLKREQIRKMLIRAEIEEFFASYGVSKADLVFLPEAIQFVKSQKDNFKVYEKPVKSEEQKKKESQIATPSQYIQQFESEVERYYPDGNKPKAK